MTAATAVVDASVPILSATMIQAYVERIAVATERVIAQLLIQEMKPTVMTKIYAHIAISAMDQEIAEEPK